MRSASPRGPGGALQCPAILESFTGWLFWVPPLPGFMGWFTTWTFWAASLYMSLAVLRHQAFIRVHHHKTLVVSLRGPRGVLPCPAFLGCFPGWCFLSVSRRSFFLECFTARHYLKPIIVPAPEEPIIIRDPEEPFTTPYGSS